jgi:trans-2-enoyl-CoA reductase
MGEAQSRWATDLWPSLQIPLMLETLAKLVNADKLRIDYTDYELCDEFKEALEHAQVRARQSAGDAQL